MKALEKTETVVWTKNYRGPNWLLNGDGFYLSYNPNTNDGHSGLTELGNLLGANLKNDVEETALCDKRTGTWYILEGDFRKQYGEVFLNGFDACLKVYAKYKADYRSNWSTD